MMLLIPNEVTAYLPEWLVTVLFTMLHGLGMYLQLKLMDTIGAGSFALLIGTASNFLASFIASWIRSTSATTHNLGWAMQWEEMKRFAVVDCLSIFMTHVTPCVTRALNLRPFFSLMTATKISMVGPVLYFEVTETRQMAAWDIPLNIPAVAYIHAVYNLVFYGDWSLIVLGLLLLIAHILLNPILRRFDFNPMQSISLPADIVAKILMSPERIESP